MDSHEGIIIQSRKVRERIRKLLRYLPHNGLQNKRANFACSEPTKER